MNNHWQGEKIILAIDIYYLLIYYTNKEQIL